MNAQDLLKHYARISEAPDAIPKLRRFVLDLAVRGKLVEQDAADQRIEIAIKKFQKDPERAVPTGWKATTVGQILDFKYGKGKKASERLETGPVPVFGSNGVVGYTDETLSMQAAIIIGRKGSAGALNICDGPSWTTDVAYYVEPPKQFQIQYLMLTLKALDLDALGKGVKPGLSRADAYPLEIHIPPLAEQHRIVAKVDELMALCDRLEEARTAREGVRDKLTAASLARLTAPDTSDTEFQSHARFALLTLPALTTRPDQIKPLRQTILNLAVRGKLVEQDAADELAGELLKILQSEKTRLVNDGAIRKQKASAALSASEKIFPLPLSWKWTRLLDLGATQTGTSPSSARDELFGDFIPFVKPADLDGPEITYDGFGLSEEGMGHSRVAPANSVMMVCIGGTLGKVNCTSRDVCFNQQINSVTPFIKGLHRYISMALKSSYFQELAWAKAGIGTLPIISKGKWEVLPIPLPPLAEQHRIVAKVDALMALCDRLEASLTTADTTRQRLLTALLHEALGGRNKVAA